MEWSVILAPVYATETPGVMSRFCTTAAFSHTLLQLLCVRFYFQSCFCAPKQRRRLGVADAEARRLGADALFDQSP